MSTLIESYYKLRCLSSRGSVLSVILAATTFACSTGPGTTGDGDGDGDTGQTTNSSGGPDATTANATTSGDGTTGSGGGTGADAECKPKFNQDLILLGDLPFVNSLAALFGSEGIEGRLAPDPATKLFSTKSIVANTSLVSGRLDWASHVTGSLDGRIAEVTGCTGDDGPCARTYIERFAHRAFRRPVTSDEVDELMVVFEEGKKSSVEDGFKLALQAVIISPSFNYRTEYGVASGNGTFALTPHEVASTLSFLLTDALPDAELLAAADSGALANAAERQQQATRLLNMDSTKDAVESTLMSAWALGNIFGKVKDETLYPEFSPGLASQMYEETRLFLRKNLWDGGLSNVLSSRKTFVNKALADLYEVPFPGTDPNDFVEVELPMETRAGLLTQASVLTARSRTDETSVVARGLFVHGPLLCFKKIPSPPESVIADVEAQLDANMSERQRAEVRATTSPCNNCHDQFDDFGLLLENYDAIGKYREVDHLGQPIDASVDLSRSASFDETVPSAVALADLLASRDEFTQCVTRHLFAYGTGEDGIQRDDCEVADITNNLTSTSTLSDVIQALVASPALTTRVSEETP